MSVDARPIIDYKVGVSFSDLFTDEILEYIDIGGLHKETHLKKYLSYGPCQTSALWFCVKRKKEIDNFIPSKYYRIYIEILVDKEIQKIYMNQTFSDFNLALKIKNTLEKNEYCIVDKIRNRKVIQVSPEGMKTNTLLKMASSQLNMNPKEASNYAQELYMKGFISYPRTGATKYSPNFNFIENLLMFKNDEKYGKKVKKLLLNLNKKNFDFSKGIEIGGHEPIFPTHNCHELSL